MFSFLAARFQYPEVLDGSAQDVLPALLATGSAGRAAWAFYSVLPLVFIPAGVAAFEALHERAAGPMRAGMLFALLAAESMMLGLMRWPSVHWELALAWTAASGSDRLVLAAVFDGLNRYLGKYLGEFLGELSFSVFFVLSGMWRNVTPAVNGVSAANNYLLPAWMIGFGAWLIVTSRRTSL